MWFSDKSVKYCMLKDTYSTLRARARESQVVTAGDGRGLCHGRQLVQRLPRSWAPRVYSLRLDQQRRPNLDDRRVLATEPSGFGTGTLGPELYNFSARGRTVFRGTNCVLPSALGVPRSTV